MHRCIYTASSALQPDIRSYPPSPIIHIPLYPIVFIASLRWTKEDVEAGFC